ncbi:MAG: hypothetical protein P1P90_02965 [Patescibacteria group bacterium]|nr:hypothetical protein [Patescibacteria group bacterium]
MHLEIIVIAGVVIAGIGAVTLATKLKKSEKFKNLTDEDRDLLKQEIEKGLVLKDEFVDTYYNIIRNEGYMHAFGGHEKQAEDLLYKMIEESKAHKSSLLNIKKQLGL